MTSITRVRTENIPEEMQAVDRWVLWQPVHYATRVAKEPRAFRRRNPRAAYEPVAVDPTDDYSYDDWDTIREEHEKWMPHFGMGFHLGDGWAGIDLDHVIVDRKVHPIAKEIIRRIASYTEISPSGTGIRIIARGDVDCWRHKFPLADGALLEIYADTTRYSTITGNTLIRKVRERGDVIQALHDEYLALFPPMKGLDLPTGGGIGQRLSVDDQEVIAVALADNPRFRPLWERSDPEPDENRLDWNMLNLLAYYTGNDIDAMRRIFEASPHYASKDNDHRKKWDYDNPFGRYNYRCKTLQKTANSRCAFNWDAWRSCKVLDTFDGGFNNDNS